MKNLNEAFGLDNIPDELKADEGKASMRDAMNSPTLDYDKTHAASLALSMHNAMMGVTIEYENDIKAMGLSGDKGLSDGRVVAALLTLAMGTAYALVRTGDNGERDKGHPLMHAMADKALLGRAFDIAMSLSAETGEAILHWDKIMSKDPGMHDAKSVGLRLSGQFGIISHAKKP